MAGPLQTVDVQKRLGDGLSHRRAGEGDSYLLSQLALLYRTRKTWSCERRVVAKVEHLLWGESGSTPNVTVPFSRPRRGEWNAGSSGPGGQHKLGRLALAGL